MVASKPAPVASVSTVPGWRGTARIFELVVTQQNLSMSSMEVLAAKGRDVRLIWKRAHNFAVADGAPAARLETGSNRGGGFE